MAAHSTGERAPATGENVARAAATSWSNPGNCISNNATDATCAAGSSGSAYLVARDFGFRVPIRATILGVTVRVEASESSTGSETTSAQLQNDSAALVGSAKTNVINGTSKVVYTYGGAADTWSATLTPAIVNHANFGVRIWYVTTHNVAIDYVTMELQLSIPAPRGILGLLLGG